MKRKAVFDNSAQSKKRETHAREPVCNRDDVDNYGMDLFFESSDQLTEDNLNWFNLYPWLAYSKYLDGIFCIPCVFFGKKSGHVDNILTKLFKEPLTYWTSASGRLKDHEASSKVHKDTALLMELFKQRMKRDIVPIDELDNSVRKQRIENGRMKLKSVLKTIILC